MSPQGDSESCSDVEDIEEGASTPRTPLAHRVHSNNAPTQPPDGPRARLTRSHLLALIAVCVLSIGSHWGMFLLGPLKTRLHREMGTSNSQFSLLIASFNLNSTWTPLVAGVLIARFGTGMSSVATTTSILLGQLVLFLGVITGQLIIMTLGLFIFGLGVTPLSVVQETLLSHLSPGNHLGISLALGLLSGKSASFVSSLVSLPLADAFGDAVPFGLAVLLCGLSFAANAARLAFRWGAGSGEAPVKEKRKVSFAAASDLGDVFWVYILLNVLCGAIWQPFLHLSSSLIEQQYGISAGAAAEQASILLSGAIILYPVMGLLTDRYDPYTPRTTLRLIQLASCLTLLAYTYLLLGPSITGTPWPGVLLFTCGIGMSPLLMVILVPKLLPPHLVPLGLGLHKSMEMASSSLSQTLAGLWLDRAKAGPESQQDVKTAGRSLIGIWWLLNLGQLACTFWLYWYESKRRALLEDHKTREAYERLPMSDVSGDSDSEDENCDNGQPTPQTAYRQPAEGANVFVVHLSDQDMTGLARSEAERTRSRFALYGCLVWILVVWTIFLGTAWSRL